MKLQREWVTPVTMGAFGGLAVTGVLMFFHLDSGLNKTAHEWLGWALLAGVAGHAAVNGPMLRRHLASARGRLLVGGFALLLAGSFLPLGGSDEPPFVAPIAALARTPLPLLAQVANTTPQDLRARLQAAGHSVSSDEASVASLVGPDRRAQVRLLGQLLKPAGGAE